MHPKQTHAIPLNLPLAAKSYRNAIPPDPVIARALKALALLLTITIVLSISSTASAKGPKNTGGKVFNKITDINAVTITVSIGADGNTHETYSITDGTKVTLNGAPANARDLRAGMVAHIALSEDRKIALIITARDAPAHPVRGRTG
jgi:hypothetical protein